jgi:acetyl-CoA carboxylase biotin carboxyl carrier protein
VVRAATRTRRNSRKSMRHPVESRAERHAVSVGFVCLTALRNPLYLNAQPEAGDSLLELKDIKAIIDLMKKNDLSVFEMEKDGFKLKLQKGAGEQTVFPPAMASMPVAPTAIPAAANGASTISSSAPAVSAPAEKTTPLKDIVSPMVGTFYRAGSPESPSFVEVGKQVDEESVVCIIEAMKVMNEIKAETSGVIAEIVAENGKPVQFGQVLFRVK